MWRLLSRLGRAVRLSEGELPGPGRPRHEAPACLRHTEEAPPPPLLGQQDSGSRGKHQQHEHGCGNLLRHCTSLEAFTWSILAVLALEVAKQVQWLNSLHPCRRRAKLCQLEGRLAVLPLHQHSVPTASAPFSGGKKPHFFLGADTEHGPGNQFPSKASPSEEHLVPPEAGASLSSPSPELTSVLLHSQTPVQGDLEQQKSFNEAASQVQQVFQTSISMAINILGLEHLQKRQHTAAFHLFELAADQNYSKAQFNVGLCYEHGRGTEKDMAKAVLYYQRAASQGHRMAQYRYAKWLLRSWTKGEEGSSVQEAVDLLDQAAAAGLAQAQVYLGWLYLKGLKTGRKTALKYSHMAAKSESSSSKFTLGLCHEKGVGPTQNWHTAEKPSQPAEIASSKLAQESLTAVVQQPVAGQSAPPPSDRMSSDFLVTARPMSFFHRQHKGRILEKMPSGRETGSRGRAYKHPYHGSK